MVYVDTECIEKTFTRIKHGSEIHQILKNKNGMNYFDKAGRKGAGQSDASLSALEEEEEHVYYLCVLCL